MKLARLAIEYVARSDDRVDKAAARIISTRRRRVHIDTKPSLGKRMNRLACGHNNTTRLKRRVAPTVRKD